MANLVPINIDKDTGKLVAKEVAGGTSAFAAVGYLHIQTISSLTWNISHNVGTTNVHVQIFDTSSNLVIPDQVHIIDINTIEVKFGASATGKAHIILFPNPIN